MNTINRKHHSLKTDPIPFGETMQGRKLWEIRLNDRDFCEGDTVTLHETASSGQEMAAGADLEYTGRSWNGMITWILHGPQYGLAEGWCIFGVVPGFADTAEDIEARLQYQLENSCPHCGGSGHKDDCVDQAARAQQSGEGREPVAWRCTEKHGSGSDVVGSADAMRTYKHLGRTIEPLYTRPSSSVSDEELSEFIINFLFSTPRKDGNRFDFDGLRGALCRIGVVSEKDGHNLVRRSSVLEIVERFRPSSPVKGAE